MYSPESFNVTNESEIDAFLRRYAFATVISLAARGVMVSHLPVLSRREADGVIISGHLARANAHSAAMDGKTEAVVLFHGPHAYVSPIWYASGPAVPTWNYAVVHAHGHPSTREDEGFLDAVLRELVDRYEAGRSDAWRVQDLAPDYAAQQLRRIVGFEMRVERLEAKFKLGQNHTAEDRAGTLAGLEREGTLEATSLANFMREHLKDG